MFLISNLFFDAFDVHGKIWINYFQYCRMLLEIAVNVMQ